MGAAGEAARRAWPRQREGRLGASQGARCAHSRLLGLHGRGQGVRCCLAPDLELNLSHSIGDAKGWTEDRYREVPQKAVSQSAGGKRRRVSSRTSRAFRSFSRRA